MTEHQQEQQSSESRIDIRMGLAGLACHLIGDELRARVFANLLANNESKAEGLGEALRLLSPFIEDHFGEIQDHEFWGTALEYARHFHAAHHMGEFRL